MTMSDHSGDGGPIRVLIADDQPLYRRGLEVVLHTEEHIEVVGEAENGEEAIAKAEELAPEDDTWTQAAWRSTRAKLIALANGDGEEALELARQGVELLQTTDAPVWRANGLSDYATVLEAYGQTDEARACFEEALSLYESKAASVPAKRTRMRLNQIGSGVVVAGASTPRAR